MQPGGAHKGVSGKSELFHSLKVYLNNKNRLQPIIGLGSVTECVKAGTHNREALYLCEVCVCRLSKADIRNHIMGSLHRYNYIKAWHPHFVAEWKKSADLSKLAWPLMEMAKILERREGPGEVQVLEFEEAVYQEMASHNEADAVTLLNTFRRGQGQSEPWSQSETTSAQLERPAVQSQRVVLPPQKHLRQSKKPVGQPLKAITQLQTTSAQTDKPLPLIQSTAAPPVKLKENASVLQMGNNWKSLEPPVQSENSNSFIDGYTGTKPLIGLNCVIECRSEEDGHPYCFICHCCRIKSIKDDIIDHLTSSSHLFNYMMEVHPEQVEVMMAGINGNRQLLQSVAKKVEQEEGRGELKVMRVPASLCILLTGNSYHWCMKMLSNGNGWTSTNIQKRKIPVKGPSVGVIEASDQGMPQKRSAVLSKQANREKKRKKIVNVTNPVFKVSLPLTKGSTVLERTPFSLDSLPVSPTHSPTADPDLSPSSEIDPDSGLLAINQAEHTSQPQLDFFSGGTDAHTDGRYLGQERNFKDTQCEEVDSYFSDSQCFNQSENMTGTNPYEQRIFHKPAYETEKGPTHASFLHEKQGGETSNCSVSEIQNAYEERNNGRWHHTLGGLIKTIYKDRQNEGSDRDEGLTAAVYHTQDWSTYNSYHSEEEGCTEEEQQYNSNFQNKVSLRVEVPREEGQRAMNSGKTQRQYYQHQPQQQHLAPPLFVHRSNMDPHVDESIARSGGIAAEPRTQFIEREQRGWQTLGYMQFSSGYVQTAPHGYTTQPMAYASFHLGRGVTSDPYYNTGPRTNPDLHLPPPNPNVGGHRSQPHVFILPGQAQGYGTHSEFSSRGAGNGLSGMMMPGNVGWAPSPYMVTYPSTSPTSAHLGGPHWDHISAQSTGVPVGSNHTQMVQHF
ncbi:uncharacterized protein [Centroberyx affinis]|uniref:uncharacterized protein n=1 Tax=Centroberyx affinis TaxID=166261 RepID=UPI003A5BFF5A